MTEQRALGVDVGGTTVRVGVVDRAGSVLQARSFDPQSHADAAVILDRFAAGLRMLVTPEVRGIGIGFPGPFDYDRGISRMRGLGKYGGIYGLAFGAELRRRLALAPEVPLRFLNDAVAFGLGEVRFGAAHGLRRVLCLTIGTGCGSAFFVDGQPVFAGEGVPPDGWVFGLPVEGTIIDEVVSRRGILRLWGRGDGLEVAEIAAFARAGAAAARSLWETFGTRIATALTPVLTAFRPEALVLGGRITKAFDLFGPALVSALADRGLGARAIPALDIDRAAVRGAAVAALEHGSAPLRRPQ